MCTPDPAIHPKNILYSPDEDFLVAAGMKLDRTKFHYIEAVASKQKIPKTVGHRVKSCKTAKTGLDQCLTTKWNGLPAMLEPTDWGTLIATACCHGHFGQGHTADPLVLISGDKNLAKVGELRFQLSVLRLQGKTRWWHFISRPDVIKTVKEIYDAKELPFQLA